jgi:hypothetical protein
VTVADATSPDEEVIDNPCPAHPGRGGAPVWCHPCGDRIAAALDRLPGLAGELALRGISDAGRLAATGEAGRATHAKVTGSPSGSPAWDAADEIIEWAVSVEDQLRAHLHSRVVRATGGCVRCGAGELPRPVGVVPAGVDLRVVGGAVRVGRRPAGPRARAAGGTRGGVGPPGASPPGSVPQL